MTQKPNDIISTYKHKISERGVLTKNLFTHIEHLKTIIHFLTVLTATDRGSLRVIPFLCC